MTEAWVYENLAALIKNGVLVLEETSQGMTSVTILEMASNFAALSLPVTYAALSSTPLASQGWQKYFDQWKANGLIS